MAVIEMLLGLRSPQGLEGEIVCYMDSGVVQGVVNGSTDTECIGELQERFAKLRARDALLGAVLARLGADPGARESEAHNAVGRLLADRENVSKIADRYIAAAEKIAHCLSLTATKPDELADQVLGQHAELTEALAKAQDEVKALIERASAAESKLVDYFNRELRIEDENASITRKLTQAQDEAIKLRAELEASAKALEAANAKRERDFNAAREAQREIGKLKAKLAEADLERMMAEATTDGMWTTLKALEHALRSRLPLP